MNKQDKSLKEKGILKDVDLWYRDILDAQNEKLFLEQEKDSPIFERYEQIIRERNIIKTWLIMVPEREIEIKVKSTQNWVQRYREIIKRSLANDPYWVEINNRKRFNDPWYNPYYSIIIKELF